MPLLTPQYAQHIIVGVQYTGCWNWYVTERDCWFMDLRKLEEAYRAKGFPLYCEGDYSERFDIPVLDQHTAPEFLKGIHEFRVSTRELRNLVVEASLRDDVQSKPDLSDYFPSLRIDFDRKILNSCYPEPASYEHYVPEGWVGNYEDFLDKVPEEEQYWMVNHSNFFK